MLIRKTKYLLRIRNILTVHSLFSRDRQLSHTRRNKFHAEINDSPNPVCRWYTVIIRACIDARLNVREFARRGFLRGLGRNGFLDSDDRRSKPITSFWTAGSRRATPRWYGWGVHAVRVTALRAPSWCTSYLNPPQTRTRIWTREISKTFVEITVNIILTVSRKFLTISQEYLVYRRD